MKQGEPKLLSQKESARLCAAYVAAFLEVTSKYYRERIATKSTFSDGMHSTGYLWDCIPGAERITEQQLKLEVVRHEMVFVMADDHSRDRVITPPLWPFPGESVIKVSSEQLLAGLAFLPEDLYVFDESMTWTLILTHEHDRRRRICLAISPRDTQSHPQ